MAYFLSILTSTFLLEDVALIAGLALVHEQKLSFVAAFAACFFGISLGDMALYSIGYALCKWGISLDKPTKSRLLEKTYTALAHLKHSKTLSFSIVISRVIPGTRLPTYLAAGFLGSSFLHFFLLTVVSVFFWVGIAMLAGQSFQAIFRDHWALMTVPFLLGLNLLKCLLVTLSDPWSRRAFVHSWRKWCNFEFWPGWFFYIPIVPLYLYLSVKYRSLLTPFYTHPHILNGGIIGESKWDFLQHLRADESSTLKSIKVDKSLDFETVASTLFSQNLSYPLIIKPDVGQRGFGVRIVRNDFDLNEYIHLSDFDRIIQPLSILPREAGLFYIRKPSEQKGRIFSITTKKFPTVIGDGQSKWGELILADQRARIIAPVYFARHRDILDVVPLKDEVLLLSECGNHCQGAIFINGNHLTTPALTDELDRITKHIPDFYFGRFDIRYLDDNSLRQGAHFEILEINGAGSEATHIWDARTSMREAYTTLLEQWQLLFEIGHQVKQFTAHGTNVSGIKFLKESYRVFFRKENLSISS